MRVGISRRLVFTEKTIYEYQNIPECFDFRLPPGWLHDDCPMQPAVTGTPFVTVAPTLVSTFTPEATLTPTETVHPTSTPFDLPLNEHNYEGVYCQYPPVKLPIAEAQGLSEDEIAERLLEMTLAYFNDPEAPDWCRVDGFTIDGISYDELTPLLPLEPKGDWMRAVKYSVKLIQVPNFWMSLPMKKGEWQ